MIPSRAATMAKLMRGYSRVMQYRRDQKYSVADRLEERARDAADTPFIIFEAACMTFAEANARANRVAHVALSFGLRRGDVVALMMFNEPDYVVIWLGLAKIGVVSALINTSISGPALEHALGQVAAKAVIAGAELMPAVLAAEVRPELLLAHGDLLAAMTEAPADDPDPAWRAGVVLADPLYFIFTSGTTGLPKAAKMSHLRFINSGEMVGGLMEFGAEDVFYGVLPLYHGAGGMVVPSVCLTFGRPFVLRRRFSARGFWPDVRRHQVTAFYYIGEICRYLLAAPPAPQDRDHTLRVMTGAGLRADVWREFVARFGVRDVYENLGATESNYGITNVDNIPGSVGRLPYPEQSNIRVLKYDLAADCHVRDEAGRPVWALAGEVGELVAEVLEGNGVAGFFEGYTSEAATEAKLLRDLARPGDCWVKSGDLVRFDAEDYFYFVDRVGDTFRWKSENVSTEEVALALAGFPGPVMVNVYGVAMPGEEGKAGMVALTYDNPAAFDGQAFYAFAVATLPAYAVPVFVRVGRGAAMTPTFKLRKLELRREGFDPALVGDDVLFVADADAGRYVALRAHDPATPDRSGQTAVAGQNRTLG